MPTITMYIDPATLGDDAEYPEAFARYCEERLEREYPGADVTVTIGNGPDDLPADITGNELWDDYCGRSREDYVRLADAIPEPRRAGYLAQVSSVSTTAEGA